VSGQWEIVIASAANPSWTCYVETNLQQTNTSVSSQGAGVVFALNQSQGLFSPGCDGGGNATATATVNGSSLSGTFTEIRSTWKRGVTAGFAVS
jgi:hypothetical protein